MGDDNVIKITKSAMKIVSVTAMAKEATPTGRLGEILLNIGVNLASSFIYDDINKPKSLSETRKAVTEATNALRKTQEHKEEVNKRYNTVSDYVIHGNQLLHAKQYDSLVKVLQSAEINKWINLKNLPKDQSRNPAKVREYAMDGLRRLENYQQALKVDLNLTDNSLKARKSDVVEAQGEFKKANEQNVINKNMLHLPTDFSNLQTSIKQLETQINEKLKSGVNNPNQKGANSELISKMPEYCKKIESAIQKLETGIIKQNVIDAKVNVDIDNKADDNNPVAQAEGSAISGTENNHTIHEALETGQTGQEKNPTGWLGNLWSSWKEGINETAQKMGDWSTNMKNVATTTAQSMQSTMNTVFLDAVQGRLKSFADYFKSFANSILQSLSNGLANSLSNSLIGWITGKMADGGPVAGGETYLVGERGPELFIPNTSGTIIPNNRLNGGLTIKSINVINNTGVQATATASTQIDTDGYVVNVILNALATNKGGLRDALAR
jgi:hypothetical protein